jgi:Patatin-like phospholipase
MQPVTMTTEVPLRLLALGIFLFDVYANLVADVFKDGGGVRGVSELVILQELMLRIQKLNGLPSTPKPCEIFDIICGTSTGGLAALLLGRLRLSIKEAISEYLLITERVFSKPKKHRSEGVYSAKFLEQAMKDVVQRYGTPKDSSGKADPEMTLLEAHAEGTSCRV